MSGSATGGVHQPVLDSQHRPITAGGFVKSGPVVFMDVADKAGLGSWRHRMGTGEKGIILDTIGSGVALLDYDNDGWLDIYLVNGSYEAAQAGKATPPHAALFHNNHDGTFRDVALTSGVTNDRWGFGAVAADYDNDGWPDIYVSNYGENRLYHNNHDGTFTDVAVKARVTVSSSGYLAWSTGATWGDYDGDGKLDLFVPGYVHMDAATVAGLSNDGSRDGCQFRGVKVMCGPRGLPGEPDHLFHNEGDGTFKDVSKQTGLDDSRLYYGLASVFIDLNGDGRPDLLVADDSTPNYLYLNKGGGKFEDDSFASGYALNEGGRETASMGIGTGDYLHNGRVDIYNTTFSDDYNPLYRNDGDASFNDVSYEAGLGEPTIPFLGWGNAFFDYDNDGWLDLMVSNGHVYPAVDLQNWGTSWAQRPLLFHNLQGKWEVVPPVEGSGLAKVETGRGLAYGDLFNNGIIDVVINNIDASPSLFKNVQSGRNHWVGFRLVGGTKSPRDGVGATIFLTANGFTQRADVFAGGSFASSSDPRPHFGIGAATTITKMEIHWPSGLHETVAVPGVDTIFTVTEGHGVQKTQIQ